MTAAHTISTQHHMLSNQDFIHCLCAHMDECRHLALLTAINKYFRDTLSMRSRSGRRHWLHLASRITGYPLTRIPFNTNHPCFRRHLQVLLCPWLSEPRPLSFCVPVDELLKSDAIWLIRISPLDDTTLHFEMRSPKQRSIQYALAALPGERDMPMEYNGETPSSRLAHDAALDPMLKAIKQHGLLMHSAKVCVSLLFVHKIHAESRAQLNMGHDRSVRIVHAGAIAVISGLPAVKSPLLALYTWLF